MSNPRVESAHPRALENYAENPAVLVGPFPSLGGYAWCWKVSNCVYCGGKHLHGGGDVRTDDPRQLLGPRTAHCHFQNFSTYILTDEFPEKTDALTAKAASGELPRGRYCLLGKARAQQVPA